MVAEKYSASMDDELLDQVRAAAAKQGLTVSSWLARAADHQIRLQGLGELVSEWEAEHGAITVEELDAFERELSDARAAAADRKARAHRPTKVSAPVRKSVKRNTAAGSRGKVVPDTPGVARLAATTKAGSRRRTRAGS